MAENKTTETIESVTNFLGTVADETKRADSFRIIEIFAAQTGYQAKMWGTAIVGFGSYHYKYDSGRQGNAPLAGFSPRKDSIALYLSPVFSQKDELLQQFGKHKTGKGCIYIKKLADINEGILKKMIANSIESIKADPHNQLNY